MTRTASDSAVAANVSARRRQWRRHGSACLLACLAAAPLACSASQGAAVRLWEFPGFTVELPLDWACKTFKRNEQHDGFWQLSGAGARCLGPKGLFFDVVVDIGIDPPPADGYWLTKVLPGGRIELAEKPLCKGPTTEAERVPFIPDCPGGDGRLDIYSSFEAGGHVYVLGFGNELSESEESLPLLRQVLRGFRYR